MDDFSAGKEPDMRPQTSIEVTYRGAGDALLTVTGVIDATGIAQLEQRLGWLLDGGASSVVVDLSGVRHCDPRLLDVLRQADDHLRGVHGGLHSRGLNPDSLSGSTASTPPDAVPTPRTWLAATPAGQAPDPDATAAPVLEPVVLPSPGCRGGRAHATAFGDDTPLTTSTAGGGVR